MFTAEFLLALRLFDQRALVAQYDTLTEMEKVDLLEYAIRSLLYDQKSKALFINTIDKP